MRLKRISTIGNWRLHKIANPLDLGGIYKNSDILSILDLVLSFDELDGAILSIFDTGPPMYKPFTCPEVVTQVEGISNKLSKPVAMHIVSNPFFIAQLKRQKGFPIFDTVEDAVGALSTQWKFRRYVNRIRSPFRDTKNDKKAAEKIMAEFDPGYPNDLFAMRLAMAYGIQCELPFIAYDLEDAMLKAAKIGYPVVMKISSPDIIHKSDMGCVKTDIRDEKELKQAYFEIMDAVENRLGASKVSGLIVQKMIAGGMELILGGKRDCNFGPVVMFGLGGIFAEALKDASFRLAPICREEAYEMIEEIKGCQLLKGIRGKRPFDIPSLADAIVSLSLLLKDFPQIAELDLNPVKVFEKGLIAVDGRIRA
ncbi:hypothetical protein PITCH_A1070043 [uncultured Desulfobacterium sp.]|uniref:ATP-grasp domain-containing protein n=1 Tax=uncultured Desulfobacterium sp. TaxID=201089 RepID=A0A445MR22_9BACT|nr:hypothetical protein PITCH_A1070043 [uncultured Desulfobacterium sp.]